MDSRTTPATARIAHVALRGKVAAAAFTEGEPLRVVHPLADLLKTPNGDRLRQLWLGERFTVIDRDQGHVYGFAAKDGYCGWLVAAALGDTPEPSHWIASAGTVLYPEARTRSRETALLPMGARLLVTGASGTFAETPLGFVPASHLRKIGDTLSDPVAVAAQFLHSPYLWGGNSRFGIDCSGLVQAAFLACGLRCAGDSDLQQDMGQKIAEDDALRRGDLLFWKGHVAIVANAQRLIHANGQTMSVAYENIADCIARILDQDGGPITHRRRL